MTALNEYTADKVHMPGPRIMILTSSWRESYLETRHLVKFHQFLRIARFLNDATLGDTFYVYIVKVEVDPLQRLPPRLLSRLI